MEQRVELSKLREALRVSNLLADPAGQPEIRGSLLPEKVLPIPRAAVASERTYPITSDRKHFGKKVAGVLVVRPVDYLAGRGQ